MDYKSNVIFLKKLNKTPKQKDAQSNLLLLLPLGHINLIKSFPRSLAGSRSVTSVEKKQTKRQMQSGDDVGEE